jgi:hypothetical protein
LQGGWRDWLAERMRVWQVTECLRCGKPLYGRFDDAPLPDGQQERSYGRRRDTLYHSNACRQAAYRERKKRERQRSKP